MNKQFLQLCMTLLFSFAVVMIHAQIKITGNVKKRDTLANPYQIDFVLSGHIHDYERLTKKYDDHTTTFVVSGGAGGGIEPKDSNPEPKMDRLIKQHHFGRMTLQKNKAMMYIYDINGDIIDQLTIQKPNK